MKPYFAIFVVVFALIFIQVQAFDCPPSSQVVSCSPKCIQDAECSSMGGKCCPNLCNYKSCIIPKSSNNGKGGSKGVGGSNGGSGTYCGNTKCMSFEKCDKDKSTGRFKCVRA